jgi:endonuclease/exonuclease/phosphatase (EEP) superfamily protein YafD
MTSKTAAPTSTAHSSQRSRRGFPAFLCAILGGVSMLAVPFLAHSIDGSADEFSTRTVPVFPAIGWLVCAGLATVVVTHRLQIWFDVDEGSVLAVAYDVLPLVLFLAPIVWVIAVISGHLLLAAAGVALTVYHGVLVVPRLVSQRPPIWARTAPQLQLAMANVYVDNSTPSVAARQLIECGAAIIVIAEATPTFMQVFDSVGGDVSHPHRVSDPTDTSDYAVAIASTLALGEGSGMTSVGELRLAVAEVEVDGVVTTIVGLNPRSTFDKDGQEIWKDQMEDLKAYVPTVAGPLVVAGDLNSTEFRPEFEDLLKDGLDDAIDSLGQAWKPSFSLKSVWPLGAIGVIARLDQALVNDQVCALKVRNLKPCGSDHLPFVITLAIRSSAAGGADDGVGDR